MAGTLISAPALAPHLRDPDWIIVDCRHDLSAPQAGREAFQSGHIPGATFMQMDEDLSSPADGRNGRHPLPDPHQLVSRLNAAGIGAHTQVVVYDAHGGMMAARLWWLLRWIGHDAVAVLDGGLPAWLAAGLALEPGSPTPHQVSTTPLVVRLRPWVVRCDQVLADLQARASTAASADGFLLVDARAATRFRGENETLDPVGGHVPGAINRPFADNLADARFKSATDLRADWLTVLGGQDADAVVHMCGSGVSACHNVLAMELAGLSGSRLYAGSWSEWCADPARPVATGEAR